MEFINKIFLPNIIIYNNSYNLIGFVSQPSDNHYIAYFKNFNHNYPSSINKWFKLNDMKGYYEELKNPKISLINIRS